MVRDRNNLLWFSDLLNEVYRANKEDKSHLDIRIQTYVTQKRKGISTHVFRWLLEKHRTKEHPQSPLTGLENATHFGRPNLQLIMEEHYQDMCKALAELNGGEEKGVEKHRLNAMGKSDEIKVGIFFCGAPVIGQQLADRCRLLTARARNEGRKIEYYFMMEVFG
jgi:dual oxidase